VPSRFSALVVARDLFGDGARREVPASESCFAFVRTVFEALPFGGGKETPARRAFDRPIAMACLVERAPCLPSRMWSISSRTNSPACVEGAFPSRLSFRALSTVSLSGILNLREEDLQFDLRTNEKSRRTSKAAGSFAEKGALR
jgi:hypothetical protein